MSKSISISVFKGTRRWFRGWPFIHGSGHDFVMGFPCTDRRVSNILPNLQTQITVANGDVVQSSNKQIRLSFQSSLRRMSQWLNSISKNPFNDLFGGNSPFFNFQVLDTDKMEQRKRKLAVDQDLLFLMTVTLLQMHTLCKCISRVHGIYQLGSEI